ncbi:hypothetical protein ACFO1B_08875 [Dactylosporangium siamense]|uniref:Uncharacterized protein n=1 Tax=Dactylosporangium siamense TaxID=685454 RepID=A0A919PT47_9ACTN|nr:hypothetical protein [Dactylosporangium siamense]GIG47898.1 hypothetical protein Dsi01nite_059390 [Dactylosporangium siamense]
MTEVEDRLRAELIRSADVMRPAQDPMRRLLARRRRRLHWRWTGVLATVVALTLTGGALTTAGGPAPDVPPTPPPVGPARETMKLPITSQWTRELLAAPTRGNLAGDTALVADLTRQLAANRRFWNVDPALDRVKVLLLADVAGARMYVMAYYNDTHAVSVSSGGPPGSSTAALAGGEFGGGVEGLRPFTASSAGAELTGRPPYSYVWALAPPGCQIATSREARFEEAGTVTRTWVDQGDHVVRPGKDLTMWWRFTCGGVVRDVEQGSSDIATPATLTGPAVTERGQADPALVTQALAEWRSLPGLPVSRHRALWGGTPPGTTEPTVVVVGEAPGGGVQVCALTGTDEHPVFATVVANSPLDYSGGNPIPAGGPRAGVTTAVAASADLVVVRLPDPADPFVLSDRLLVIAPPGATKLQLTGSGTPTVPLVDGVAVITAKTPAVLTVRATDAGGATLAQLKVSEPDADGLIFGQALLRRW